MNFVSYITMRRKEPGEFCVSITREEWNDEMKASIYFRSLTQPLRHITIIYIRMNAAWILELLVFQYRRKYHNSCRREKYKEGSLHLHAIILSSWIVGIHPMNKKTGKKCRRNLLQLSRLVYCWCRRRQPGGGVFYFHFGIRRMCKRILNILGAVEEYLTTASSSQLTWHIERNALRFSYQAAAFHIYTHQSWHNVYSCMQAKE